MTLSILAEETVTVIFSGSAFCRAISPSRSRHSILVCFTWCRFSRRYGAILSWQNKMPPDVCTKISPIVFRSIPRFITAPRKSRCVSVSANFGMAGLISIAAIGYSSSYPRFSGLPKRIIFRSQTGAPPSIPYPA